MHTAVIYSTDPTASKSQHLVGILPPLVLDCNLFYLFPFLLDFLTYSLFVRSFVCELHILLYYTAKLCYVTQKNIIEQYTTIAVKTKHMSSI